MLTMSTDQTSSSGSGTGNSLNEVLESIFSYNGNVMLAAIISLLLVILFVLLLHLYAKWFLAQARRRRRRSSLSVTHVLGPTRLHHFHTLSLDSASDSPAGKGLDASVIASIPLFVYGSGEQDKLRQECVICLSGYEDGDIGRHLAKCGHAFHVECIDMWLQSHSSCPICRSPVVPPPHQDIVKPAADDPDRVQLRDDDTASSDGPVEIVIDNVGDQDRSVDETRPDGESDCPAATTPSCSCSCSCLTQLPSPATTLGSSLKRIMSCKIKSERKVHP